MADRPCSGQVDIWTASLAVPTAQLASTLGADERERASRIATAKVRRRFLARRGLRRAVLARYVGCAPSQLRFVQGDQGKPELAGREVRFSCSSSGELALVAVARDRDVGIDVERLRRIDGALEIAADILPPDQQITLSALTGEPRDAAFLRAWTRMEAAIKASGAGLGAAFQGTTSWRRGDWCTRHLDLGAGHVGAVAFEGRDCRIAWGSS